VVHDDVDENLPIPPVPKGACRVTVVRGGGSCYPKVIAEAILASDLLGKDYYVTVIAGPSTTPPEWYFFATLVGKKKVDNLVLLRSAGDYEERIRKSDVCVSVAGYHTSVMLLKHRKKAVLIPFEGYESRPIYEQPARAKMLKELIGAKILPIQDLTAKRLAGAIKKAAARKVATSDISMKWFGGAKVLAGSLTGLFGR
jgi:predicted glycosyltransferase